MTATTKITKVLTGTVAALAIAAAPGAAALAPNVVHDISIGQMSMRAPLVVSYPPCPPGSLQPNDYTHKRFGDPGYVPGWAPGQPGNVPGKSPSWPCDASNYPG